MRLYYRAVTEDNKVVRGLIDARTIDEAAEYLQKHNLVPIKIFAEGDSLRKLLIFRKGIKPAHLVFFTRQLASMLSSGLSLMQALVILRKQVQNQEMADTIQGLIAAIEEGSTLSQALSKYPQIFTPIYTSLVKAAEESGVLDKVITRLADNLEKSEKLKQKIKGALIYPAIVVSMMFVVIGIMMIFVIPQLSGLYDNLGLELPVTTQLVIGLSKSLTFGWPFIIGGIVIGIYYLKKFRRTQSGKFVTDSIILRTPVFGKLITESLLTDFTRTFGMLVGTGTLVVDALQKSSDVIDNAVFKKAVVGVTRRVEKGIAIGDAMTSSSLFPPVLVEMVKIGEQTGKLDESLGRVSEYYEREVEQTVKTLTTAIEPFIMIVLAVGVGFLILSIITPIYSLINSLQ